MKPNYDSYKTQYKGIATARDIYWIANGKPEKVKALLEARKEEALIADDAERKSEMLDKLGPFIVHEQKKPSPRPGVKSLEDYTETNWNEVIKST